MDAAGISYPAFVKLTIDNAIARKQRTEDRGQKTAKASSVVRRLSSGIDIRWCRPEDRQTVLSFLSDTGFFRPDEIDIAREVLDSALAEGPKGHYQSFVAEVDGETVGWICYGPTPCTIGTYDIYWIGVSSAWQGQGIGRALTAFAEQAIRDRGGRLFVVETSGREIVHPDAAVLRGPGLRAGGQHPGFLRPRRPQGHLHQGRQAAVVLRVFKVIRAFRE